MESFTDYIPEYKRLMAAGTIQKAYRGILDSINHIRLHLKKKYPDHYVSGSLQHDYLNSTYFYFIPDAMRIRGLKCVIFFVHDTCEFQVWLAGYNKAIQAEYWELFKGNGQSKYRMPSTIEGVDSIAEHTLITEPDFRDLDALIKRIEERTLTFIEDVESFLIKS